MKAPSTPSATIEVLFETTATFVSRYDQDIRQGRLFVGATDVPPLGTRLRLVLRPPGPPAEFVLRGVVAEMPDVPQGEGGFWVRLASIAESTLIALESFADAIRHQRERALLFSADADIRTRLGDVLRTEGLTVVACADESDALGVLACGGLAILAVELHDGASEFPDHLAVNPLVCDTPVLLLAPPGTTVGSSGLRGKVVSPHDDVAFRREVREALPAKIPAHTELRLAMRPDEVARRHPNLPSLDAYVISRLAGGKLRLSELIERCPQPRHEVVEAVLRHLSSGILRRG